MGLWVCGGGECGVIGVWRMAGAWWLLVMALWVCGVGVVGLWRW